MATHGLNPYYTKFRSPVGDIIGLLGAAQADFACRDLELNVLDCTDVYGRKGLRKQCFEAYKDFHECIYLTKQMARVTEMRKERVRQYYHGERSKKDLYAEPPKLDGYMKTYGRTID